mmetsp:Transcript_29349/g.26815  ORF Transcript_29349/g.26815 Transcript_29349/m.26815 type:complete len:108 (-) Transcript_29349:507-830(-)
MKVKINEDERDLMNDKDHHHHHDHHHDNNNQYDNDDESIDVNLLVDKEENNTLDKINKVFGISWKQITKHCLHLCYHKNGVDFVEAYFEKLSAHESHKNRPFTLDED